MSLHPSLRGSKKLTSRRTVLKREEKIKWLIDKKEWREDSPVLGLPKIKLVRLKVSKKEKKEEAAAPQETKETPKKS